MKILNNYFNLSVGFGLLIRREILMEVTLCRKDNEEEPSWLAVILG
jgi:hypothetical protein